MSFIPPSDRADIAHFPPARDAALSRLDQVQPERYASTRNHLDGAVTGLSPYVTHGLLDLPEAVARLRRRTPLQVSDKLMMEFAWREFFQHVWRHDGDAIFSDLHAPVCPAPRSGELPVDIRRGATGVPVIDQAVRTLYATGYLHNHARMWLASYVVHVRHVHWRAGADWMYGHLLDGDLGSNHLSWQWVAGTFSSKPYLFNAENVARYAPASWHSSGTVIDCSYEELDRMARSPTGAGPEPGRHDAVIEPELLSAPPADMTAAWRPASLPASGDMELVHPWNLGPLQNDHDHPGVIHLPFHARFPWSARRWAFVLGAMRANCDKLYIGDLGDLGVSPDRLCTRATLNPEYAGVLAPMSLRAVPRIFADPDQRCASFSRFWQTVAPKAPKQARGAWHA